MTRYAFTGCASSCNDTCPLVPCMAGGLTEWLCHFINLAVGETAAPACFDPISPYFSRFGAKCRFDNTIFIWYSNFDCLKPIGTCYRISGRITWRVTQPCVEPPEAKEKLLVGNIGHLCCLDFNFQPKPDSDGKILQGKI
jgi:hypothetical protein